MNTFNLLELPLLHLIQQLRCTALDLLMPLVTLLGEDGLFSIALALLLLCFPKTRKAGAALAVGLLLQLFLLNGLLKPFIGRTRPFLVDSSVPLLIAPLADASFPSGHTACAFLTAAVLSRRFRRGAIGFFAVAVMVGFSRLYLFVHYPTDVLCGALCGVLLGWLSYRLVAYCSTFFQRRTK